MWTTSASPTGKGSLQLTTGQLVAAPHCGGQNYPPTATLIIGHLALDSGTNASSVPDASHFARPDRDAECSFYRSRKYFLPDTSAIYTLRRLVNDHLHLFTLSEDNYSSNYQIGVLFYTDISEIGFILV